jgi:oxalate decarboxylase/phosphoglucose isomerase-like protein (cupin superfamily)
MASTTWLKPPESSVMRSGKVCLQQGEEMGWHETAGKEEVIVLVAGTATLMMREMQGNEQRITIAAGGAHFIREGVWHSVRNDGADQLIYFYIVAGLERHM